MLNLLVVCNKLVSSFLLMLSYGFWHFHHPNLLASSVLCIALLILRVGAYFTSTSKPVGGLHPILLHISLYIFLKTTTIPTYHNISIAIPRYIVMQLPSYITVLYIMLWSYELFVPKVCCHFRVFAPARKEPRRPLKSEIEKRKKIEKREKEKKE